MERPQNQFVFSDLSVRRIDFKLFFGGSTEPLCRLTGLIRAIGGYEKIGSAFSDEAEPIVFRLIVLRDGTGAIGVGSVLTVGVELLDAVVNFLVAAEHCADGALEGEAALGVVEGL